MRVAVVSPDPWMRYALAHTVCEVGLCRLVDAGDPAETDAVLIDARRESEGFQHAEIARVYAGRGVVLIVDGGSARHPGEYPANTTCIAADSSSPEAVRQILESLVAARASADGSDRQVRLSAQERRVLMLTATGGHAAEVAAALGISPGTVSAYLRRIRAKYEIAGRPAPRKVDLYRRAIEDGVLSIDDSSSTASSCSAGAS